MASRIRKGDTVIVIAGRDKGKSGEVIEMLPKESRAVVRGINLVRRHQRQSARAEGGIISKELPIHISNIALKDANGKPTRVGFRTGTDGRKVRVAKRTGETIDG
jgi:large subunit ribosomal protein L24